MFETETTPYDTMYCIVTNARTMKFGNNNQTRQGYKGVGA